MKITWVLILLLFLCSSIYSLNVQIEPGNPVFKVYSRDLNPASISLTNNENEPIYCIFLLLKSNSVEPYMLHSYILAEKSSATINLVELIKIHVGNTSYHLDYTCYSSLTKQTLEGGFDFKINGIVMDSACLSTSEGGIPSQWCTTTNDTNTTSYICEYTNELAPSNMCGCHDGYYFSGGQCTPLNTNYCNFGATQVADGACSLGYFCSNGRLRLNISECSCPLDPLRPPNRIGFIDGVCLPSCSDGTYLGHCNSNGSFCDAKQYNNYDLVPNSSKCTPAPTPTPTPSCSHTTTSCCDSSDCVNTCTGDYYRNYGGICEYIGNSCGYMHGETCPNGCSPAGCLSSSNQITSTPIASPTPITTATPTAENLNIIPSTIICSNTTDSCCSSADCVPSCNGSDLQYGGYCVKKGESCKYTDILKCPYGCAEGICTQKYTNTTGANVTANETNPVPTIPPINIIEIAKKEYSLSPITSQITSVINQYVQVKSELEKQIGNIDTNKISNLSQNLQEIKNNLQIQRVMSLVENKTAINVSFKYTGSKTITDFMVKDMIPKDVAMSASELTVFAPGANVTILEDDPIFLITYPTVSPGQIVSIIYTLNKMLSSDYIDSFTTPLVLAAKLTDVISPTATLTPTPTPTKTPSNDITTIVMLLSVILLFGVAYVIFTKKSAPKPVILPKKMNVNPKLALSKIPSGVPAMELENLTVTAGSKIIIQNITAKIMPGELTAFIGPSGSGKSTIIEAVIGRRRIAGGTIKVLGIDVEQEQSVVNAFIGFVPQQPELNMGQTVWQNMVNSAIRWEIPNAEEKISYVLELVNLTQRKDVLAKSISGGQMKLLSLGMELMRDPAILLLDEPTTGLDPTTRVKIISILSNIAARTEKTIIFTTHFMDEVDDCDKVLIVKGGAVIVSGNPKDLKRRMPGEGKVVSITLESIDDHLLKEIEKMEGVKKVIVEGRTIRVLMENPNAIEIAGKLSSLGGVVEEARLINATMSEAFIYYTEVE